MAASQGIQQLVLPGLCVYLPSVQGFTPEGASSFELQLDCFMLLTVHVNDGNLCRDFSVQDRR